MKSNSEKAERRQMLRVSMLLTTAQFAPAEIPISTVLTALRTSGFQESEQEIAANLDYLTSKDFLIQSESVISAGLSRWKLGAAGREYLEREGLI